MASRTSTALGRALLSGSCSCRAPARVHLARLQSSAAAADAQPAPPTSPAPSHRVVASALLSRPPLILPPLSPLERSYYAYQRRIHRALAKPASVSQSWFFKKGTQAEKSFVEFEKRVAKEEEQGDLEQMKAFEMAAEEVEGAPDYVPRETEADKKGDITSLERKADRTLYLLLKKNRKEHAWQFPQGGVEGEESLLEAAKRELHEETGVNVDVWPSGRVPAGAYTYPFPAEHKKKHPEHEGAKVFFMPMRIVRGQVEPNKQDGKKGHDHKGRHEPRLERPRVWTDTYYSLLNYPVSASLSITPPGASEPSWRAKLKEEVFKEDPTSGEGPGIWHGFSKNGTAKGQLVYASRGTKEDFELLKSKGVNVEGKIVAVQYGGSFRGLKVKAAAEAGAVGVVIFTDPIEDGEVTASAGHAAYPAGPARAPSSVQRGSVQYLSLYPGDPLTPGQPSYNPDLPNAPDRLDRDDPSVNVPTIPSLPLSYEDAIPLLKSLNGKGFKLEDGREGKPEGWREGALREYGVEYFTGPGEDEIELVNNVDDKITPIWNTYALIPGHIKDEVVVIGNHHDAWTFGAGDPNSGTSSMHETVRAFGSLLEKGWKPLRTILVAAWDAEEYGLIGSTEFGEDFAPWLKKNVVAYLNVDVSVSGPIFELNASPSFADLLRNVSAQVSDPSREGKTLADVWEGGDDEEEVTDEDSEKKLLPIAALGSGSDFTVFLQRLGIASANFAMRRSKKSPVYHYHSNYDSFHWQSTFGDPTYQRHIAVSKVLGLAAVRLVDDLVLPINVTAYAVELGRYVDKVASLPLASSLDFTRLRSLTSAILLTSQRIEQKGTKVAHAVEEKGDKRAIRQLRAVNKAIKAFETGFLGDEQGLKGREWYRHLGVAPGRWLGYGATTLPGLAEALTLDQDVEQAKVEIKRLEKAFATILKGLVKGVKA